jgi:acetyltransferase-like isoleucine patch superfamily enzyme
VQPGTEPTGSLVLSDGVKFEDMVAVSAAACLVIGSNCLISSFVTITDNDHTRGDGRIVDQPQSVAVTTLGDNVWVGVGAVILKGVTIGAGAVVGANAVVTHDVAAGATVGGVPASPIR